MYGFLINPLFYIIYANDLLKIIRNCKVAIYADDTILYTANLDFENLVRKMQADLNLLSGWCQINGISVNVEKTQTMIFGRPKVIKAIQPYEVPPIPPNDNKRRV